MIRSRCEEPSCHLGIAVKLSTCEGSFDAVGRPSNRQFVYVSGGTVVLFPPETLDWLGRRWHFLRP